MQRRFDNLECTLVRKWYAVLRSEWCRFGLVLALCFRKLLREKRRAAGIPFPVFQMPKELACNHFDIAQNAQAGIAGIFPEFISTDIHLDETGHAIPLWLFAKTEYPI